MHLPSRPLATLDPPLARCHLPLPRPLALLAAPRSSGTSPRGSAARDRSTLSQAGRGSCGLSVVMPSRARAQGKLVLVRSSQSGPSAARSPGRSRRRSLSLPPAAAAAATPPAPCPPSLDPRPWLPRLTSLPNPPPTPDSSLPSADTSPFPRAPPSPLRYTLPSLPLPAGTEFIAQLQDSLSGPSGGRVSQIVSVASGDTSSGSACLQGLNNVLDFTFQVSTTAPEQCGALTVSNWDGATGTVGIVGPSSSLPSLPFPSSFRSRAEDGSVRKA